MTTTEVQFVKKSLSEICNRKFGFDAIKIDNIVESVIDDVCQDIEECADEDFNTDDIEIAFTRILLSKLIPLN